MVAYVLIVISDYFMYGRFAYSNNLFHFDIDGYLLYVLLLFILIFLNICHYFAECT